MGEKYSFDPNEGRITVDEEGNVVPDSPEPRPRTIRNDEIDEGHREITESPKKPVVQSEPTAPVDTDPNPYWPNSEEKDAAERAKTERDRVGRTRPSEPWQSTSDSDNGDDESNRNPES